MQPMMQPMPAYPMPKKETLIPIVAGVFNILSAIAWFIFGVIGSFFIFGAICFIPGIFSLIAAIFCFGRRNWVIALVLSLLGGNIIALILVAISKEEFDWPQNAPPGYGVPAMVAPYGPAPYGAPPQPQYPGYAPQPYYPPAQPQQAFRLCMKCGIQAPIQAVHCPNCGNKLG